MSVRHKILGGLGACPSETNELVVSFRCHYLSHLGKKLKVLVVRCHHFISIVKESCNKICTNVKQLVGLSKKGRVAQKMVWW